jgi:hypothetical protein
MSAAATFEEPGASQAGAVRGLGPSETGGSPDRSSHRRRVAIYGVVLVGGIAVGEAAWVATIGYALYRLFL